MHNVRNALAAAAAAYALGMLRGTIAAGLARFRGIKGRLQRKPRAAAARALIDDTYNANPDSVRAAIAVLAPAAGQAACWCWATWASSAPTRRALHAEVGEPRARAGIERLFTLGERRARRARVSAPAPHFTRIEDLLAAVRVAARPDTTVLVKGSRFMQMERVVPFAVDACRRC